MKSISTSDNGYYEMVLWKLELGMKVIENRGEVWYHKLVHCTRIKGRGNAAKCSEEGL